MSGSANDPFHRLLEGRPRQKRKKNLDIPWKYRPLPSPDTDDPFKKSRPLLPGDLQPPGPQDSNPPVAPFGCEPWPFGLCRPVAPDLPPHEVDPPGLNPYNDPDFAPYLVTKNDSDHFNTRQVSQALNARTRNANCVDHLLDLLFLGGTDYSQRVQAIPNPQIGVDRGSLAIDERTVPPPIFFPFY